MIIFLLVKLHANGSKREIIFSYDHFKVIIKFNENATLQKYAEMEEIEYNFWFSKKKIAFHLYVFYT